MNSSNSLYNLYIIAIYIKNNNTLLALFYDNSDRIILGTIDIANYTFSFKQTLPNKSGDLNRAIFLDENKYMYGIYSSDNFNTFYSPPNNFTEFDYVQGMIFYSNIEKASYTIDNTGMIIKNSLTKFPPNVLINAN
jgi:hypothetical protein